MRHEVIVGVERWRQWPEDLKSSVLREVGVGGATVADVARRHDLTQQHIYQWHNAGILASHTSKSPVTLLHDQKP